MSNYKNKNVIGLYAKESVERKTIKPRPSKFAIITNKRAGSFNDTVFDSCKLKKEIGSQFCSTLPLIKVHCFEYVEMNEWVKDQFHMSNLSDMRL